LSYSLITSSFRRGDALLEKDLFAEIRDALAYLLVRLCLIALRQELIANKTLVLLTHSELVQVLVVVQNQAVDVILR
jgi:hypothetical protein